MEKTIHLFYIGVICLLLIFSIVSSKKSYKLGRLCGEYREQLTETERTVGDIRTVLSDARNSVGRNIQTARDAVETIEELRVQVQTLEDLVNNRNPRNNDCYRDFSLED